MKINTDNISVIVEVPRPNKKIDEKVKNEIIEIMTKELLAQIKKSM